VTIAGNAKHVVTIILSVVAFATPVTPLNVVGTVLTVLAVGYYTYIDYNFKYRPADKVDLALDAYPRKQQI